MHRPFCCTYCSLIVFSVLLVACFCSLVLSLPMLSYLYVLCVFVSVLAHCSRCSFIMCNALHDCVGVICVFYVLAAGCLNLNKVSLFLLELLSLPNLVFFCACVGSFFVPPVMSCFDDEFCDFQSLVGLAKRIPTMKAALQTDVTQKKIGPSCYQIENVPFSVCSGLRWLVWCGRWRGLC